MRRRRNPKRIRSRRLIMVGVNPGSFYSLGEDGKKCNVNLREEKDALLPAESGVRRVTCPPAHRLAFGSGATSRARFAEEPIRRGSETKTRLLHGSQEAGIAQPAEFVDALLQESVGFGAIATN